ncbi:hypothetical protein ACX27_29855 [Nostoc piscinale CENA21]|uniref:Uncharacterized protein n=1 Tax=Nostoc piscinale CENA21 TaxID=224013 RepID=A0A0M5MHU2_9NOSO|nr:hypothetical protein [Nostoc piscinale]ALF56105.1 hypothetical protein ACX27_29855 [Nostoc piscinale CENA21]
MALAQHISINQTKRVDHHFSSKIAQIIPALFNRLLWHTKAYTTVFGILFLTLASLVFLCINWSGKKLTQVFQYKTVVEQE